MSRAMRRDFGTRVRSKGRHKIDKLNNYAALTHTCKYVSTASRLLKHSGLITTYLQLYSKMF